MQHISMALRGACNRMDSLAQEATLMAAPPCQVLMVHPRFTPPSFWNCRVTCELFGARYPLPPLGLIRVAALWPPSWEVLLGDGNTGDITRPDLDAAELIMAGGMLSQLPDTVATVQM